MFYDFKYSFGMVLGAPNPIKSMNMWFRNAYQYFNEFVAGRLCIFRGLGEAQTLDFDECIMVFKVFEKSDVPPLVPTFGDQKSSKIDDKCTKSLKKSLSRRPLKII